MLFDTETTSVSYYTVAALCNAHGQCDQIFVKGGVGRLRQ